MADRLRTIDVATGAGTVLASSPNLEWIDRPCWAPDGRVVALEYRSTRWSLQRRYVAYGPAGSRQILGRANRLTTHAALAPGCARVAERRRRLPTGGRGVLVRDLAGAPLAELLALPGAAAGLAWSPDGVLLADAAVLGDEVLVRTTGVATAAASELRLAAGPGRVSDVAPSPLGDRVVVAAGGRLLLFDAGGADLGAVAPGARAHSVAWSPDGAWIAFSARRPTGTSHYVVAAAPGARHRLLLRTPAHAATPLAWSPDGARLAVGGG